jgi:hypothetical protein
MSFKVCRGTLGSLAMFTAIRNASSRVSSFAADRCRDGRWMDLWGGPAFALRLSHKIAVGRYDHAKQRFFPAFIATPRVAKD